MSACGSIESECSKEVEGRKVILRTNVEHVWVVENVVWSSVEECAVVDRRCQEFN